MDGNCEKGTKRFIHIKSAVRYDTFYVSKLLEEWWGNLVS